MARRVFITVAEVSGDVHAAELIRALRELDDSTQFDAIGGRKMREAGAHLVYESVGAAAMGWRGALRVLEVAKLLKETRRRYEDPAERPDLHICIDSSAMNLPFARLAKSFGVPVLYYIAPQLWASREGRMKKLRAYVDRVACILPFEEQYFRSHGVDATFVGHPLFDELPRPHDREPPPGPRFPDVPPTIGIIPGSRKSEVTANFPHLIEVAKRISANFPGAKFLVPTTPASQHIVMRMINEHGFGSMLVHLNDAMPQARGVFTVKLDAFDEFIPQCDLCLCKSGTSTLHVAAYCVPMIVVYRVNRVAWHALGRWLVKSKKIALVNILAGNVDLVPEFVPWYGSNEPVAACAIDLLSNPHKLNDQRRKLMRLVKSIDRPGASMNTARLAMEMIDGSSIASSALT